MNANQLIKQSQHNLIARSIHMQQGQHDAPHQHPWHQLILARTGVLRTRAANKEYFIPYNRAILIPAGCGHESWAVTAVEFLGVYFNPECLTLETGQCKVLELSRLFRELIFYWVNNVAPLAKPNQEQRRMTDVFFDLANTQTAVDFELSLPRDPRAKTIAETLLADPTCTYSLAAWAEESGASERTIERLFSNQTGMTFSRWRQKLRLYHSLSMLEQGVPVKKVAMSVGYRSASAFIYRFKSEFAITPHQYSTKTLQK